MRAEAGVHRIQRVPTNERRDRVHSSTVTVAIMDGAPTRGLWQLREDKHFRVEWFSGQGAGGQHRNKHQNSARLVHLPTGLIRCAQTRSRANSLDQARQAMDQALDAMGREQAARQGNAARVEQIGRQGRAGRERIWRFQDDIVMDSRTGRRTRCHSALRGGMDALWQENNEQDPA